MTSFRFLQIPQESPGFLRLLHDSPRFRWILQDSQGFRKVRQDSSGSADSKGSIRFSNSEKYHGGSSEVFQDSPHFPERFLRLPQDSLRSLWTPLDSGGFFRVPVDSRSFLKTPQGVSNSPRPCRIPSDSSWICSFLWISLGSSGSFRFLNLPSASTRFLRRFR